MSNTPTKMLFYLLTLIVNAFECKFLHFRLSRKYVKGDRFFWDSLTDFLCFLWLIFRSQTHAAFSNIPTVWSIALDLPAEIFLRMKNGFGWSRLSDSNSNSTIQILQERSNRLFNIFCPKKNKQIMTWNIQIILIIRLLQRKTTPCRKNCKILLKL